MSIRQSWVPATSAMGIQPSCPRCTGIPNPPGCALEEEEHIVEQKISAVYCMEHIVRIWPLSDASSIPLAAQLINLQVGWSTRLNHQGKYRLPSHHKTT